MDVSIWIN